MHDLIIIGGGPAALSAAFYALDKQLDVVIVYEDLGGKVGWRESLVGNGLHQAQSARARHFLQELQAHSPQLSTYLPANDLVRLLIARIMRDGHVLHDRALTVTPGPTCFSVETRAQGTLQASSVIIATGATPRLLNVPGAQRLIDQGMCYSIMTYASQSTHSHATGNVAVIGSMPRAILGTAELAQHAEQVWLIVDDAAALATPLGQALRRQTNVEILVGYDVLEVIGQHSVDALALRYEQQTRWLTVQRIFVDLGLQPNSALVHDLVATDAEGFIIVDHANATSVPGLFAAGDVTVAPGEQVFVAIGDGARAAISAYEYCLARRLTLAVTGEPGSLRV